MLNANLALLVPSRQYITQHIIYESLIDLVTIQGSVAQFVGDFDLIMGLVKVFDEVCGKSLVFDRRGARAKARRLAPRLV
jgi:hypothetical protein